MHMISLSLEQRKKVVLLLLGVIVIAFCIIFGSIAFAAGANDVSEFMNQMFMSLFSTNQIEAAADIMLGRTNGFYDSSNALGSAIMPAFKGLAGAIILVNTTVVGFREFTKGEVNVDAFLKILLKFVISLTVIFMIDEILGAIESAGFSIATFFHESLSSLVGFDPLQVTEVEGSSGSEFALGVWMSLSSLSNLVIPCLIIEILNMFVKIVSYGIFFELVMRRALIPIALANMFNDGPRSPGMLFLKRYLALYLRIGLIFIVLGCAYAFINASLNINSVNWNDLTSSLLNPLGGSISYLGNAFLMMFDAICVMIASCAFITKGSNLIEEVFAIR